MVLANLAWMLAMNNKQVLVIDWDLEAPGVHRYFHPFLEDKELQSTRGLMDFVEDLAARAAASPQPLPDEEGDVSSYVVSLGRAGWNWEEFGERAGIDLIPAGQQNAGYSKKLNSFDWISFYTKLDGRRLLSYMASQLTTIYDYILIDSRTGVSDTSGICTVELPDTVVVCFTLNEQSIRGAANVSESIISQRAALDEHKRSENEIPDQRASEFRIYPVPTRIEQSENSKKQIGLSLVQKTFSRYLGDVSQDDLRRYWGDLQMPYVPVYAFEEVPAVFGDLPYDQLSICAFIARLAKVLTKNESISLQALQEERRLEALKWFQRPSEIPQDPAQLAEEAFQHLSDELKRESIQVLLRLVQFTPHGISPQALYREELQTGLSEAVDALIKARILRTVSTQGGQAFHLAEPSLLQIWSSYKAWIQNDLQFLQWRQTINSAARSWRLRNQRESDLLRSDSLEDAKRYWRTRAEELNVDEKDYLSASIQRDEQRRIQDDKDHSNKVALELNVARLEKELTYRGSATAKEKWYSSTAVVVFCSLSLVLATALAAGYYYVKERDLTAETQAQMATAQRVEAEHNLAMEQQREAELRKELVLLDSKLSNFVNYSKGSTASTGTSEGKSPSPKSGGSLTTQAGSDKSLICHILATKFPWTLPGQILVTANDKAVGSFDIGADGSSGLDFTCRSGENSIQMTEAGYSGVCSLKISTRDALQFSPRFNLTNGSPPSCSLQAILPVKKE